MDYKGNSFSNSQGGMPHGPGGESLNGQGMAFDGVVWTDPGAPIR